MKVGAEVEAEVEAEMAVGAVVVVMKMGQRS